MLCAFICRGSKASRRLPDGTLFIDDPDFDAISWSGVHQLVLVWPKRFRRKHARWRCYTPTQIVGLLERAGLRFVEAYEGLSKTPYSGTGPEAGRRLALVAVRET